MRLNSKKNSKSFGSIKKVATFALAIRKMVGVAQLVRVSDCGPEGRGFDPLRPPRRRDCSKEQSLFLCDIKQNLGLLRFGGIKEYFFFFQYQITNYICIKAFENIKND